MVGKFENVRIASKLCKYPKNVVCRGNYATSSFEYDPTGIFPRAMYKRGLTWVIIYGLRVRRVLSLKITDWKIQTGPGAPSLKLIWAGLSQKNLAPKMLIENFESIFRYFRWKWVNRREFFTRAFSLITYVFEDNFTSVSILCHHKIIALLAHVLLPSNIRSQKLCASSKECGCRPIRRP